MDNIERYIERQINKISEDISEDEKLVAISSIYEMLEGMGYPEKEVAKLIDKAIIKKVNFLSKEILKIAKNLTN